MRHARLIAAGLALALAAILGVTAWIGAAAEPAPAEAQVSREAGGDEAITVTATRGGEPLLAQPGIGPDLSGMAGKVLPFAIALDTHAGDLSDLDLNGRVFLRDSTGVEIPGIVKQTSRSAHHTSYVAAFPRLDSRGVPLDDAEQGSITLVVRGVGAERERILKWELALGSLSFPLRAGLAAALGVAGLWLAVPLWRRRGPGVATGGGSVRPGWVAAGALALLTLLLAGGWVVVALAAGKAGLREAVTNQAAAGASSAQAATRSGSTESGARVQVTLATPDYFEQSGQAALGGRLGADSHLVFLVSEEHFDRSAAPPVPLLAVNGAGPLRPVGEEVLADSEHHRTRAIRFARADGEGRPLAEGGAHTLELQWPDMKPAHAADHSLVNPLRWEDALLVSAAAPVQVPLSPWLFLTLTAGLFAALSPCLIQLTVYYLSTLTGVSLSSPSEGSRANGPVVRTALWFVAGVVIAYTAGGALAGVVGQQLQSAGLLGSWNRPVAVLAGLIIVGMGIYAGAAARAPMLCRLPLPRLTRFAQGRGGFGNMVMGGAVALGCLQCFGGAIFASLLAYVGSLGSPLLGAGMLFLFSLGVAVPFLLAALAWSRVAPYLARLERVTPYVALASSGMMILFGALMIADRFHWVSNLVLKMLPFLQA